MLGNINLFLRSLGRLQEALALREAIVRRDPVNVMAFNSLGSVQQSTDSLMQRSRHSAAC